MTKHFPHLRDITSEIPPLDEDANVELLLGRDAPELLNLEMAQQGLLGPRGCYWAGRSLVRRVSIVQAAPCTFLRVLQHWKMNNQATPFRHTQRAYHQPRPFRVQTTSW